MTISGTEAIALLVFALLGPASAAAQTCAPVGLLERTGGFGAYVNASGRFCLPRDIKQATVYDIHAGSYKSLAGKPLLTISCGMSGACPNSGGSYDIDLQGHAMVAEPDGMRGVDNKSGGLGVRIHHGSISVKGSSSIGIYLRGGRMSLKDGRSQANKAPFMITDYVIEHMNIRAGGQGLNINGGNNILRDSVIEVDGHTAAYLFGPDSIVENNTFIVHGSGDLKTQHAALQLRDADRAVVRNNRFIFKGNWLRRGGVAISLLDSAGVTLAGNSFAGFDQQLLLDGATTSEPK